MNLSKINLVFHFKLLLKFLLILIVSFATSFNIYANQNEYIPTTKYPKLLSGIHHIETTGALAQNPC